MKLKKIISNIIICSLLVCGLTFNVNAKENSVLVNTSDITIKGYAVSRIEQHKPYFVDQYGKVTYDKPSEGTYVEVLYDSRWDSVESSITARHATIAYQYININNIVLKGSPKGHYANDIYNTKITVGMYVYFNTDTLKISKVKDPTVLSTNCPLISRHGNATVKAKASGGRAYATGYITYYEPFQETLTGTGSWGFL